MTSSTPRPIGATAIGAVVVLPTSTLTVRGMSGTQALCPVSVFSGTAAYSFRLPYFNRNLDEIRAKYMA